MKKRLKGEKESNEWDKTVMNNDEDSTFMDPKAEDQLRQWMQKSSLCVQSPAVTDNIVEALQQAAFQRSIKWRRRKAFWWILLSLGCGCSSLMLVSNLMQKDIGAGLQMGQLENHPFALLGHLDLAYGVLAFVAFVIVGMLMELLLSFLSGAKPGHLIKVNHQPG